MQYEIHVTAKDMMGSGLVETLLELGALGATVKPNTYCRLSFPQQVTLVLEADEPPMPNAQVRVFDYKKKEVFAKALEEQRKEKEKAEKKEAKKQESVEAANFSTEQEEEDESGDVDNSLATNDEGKPWTKEQLEDLDWPTFKKALKQSFGITGRNRPQMQKQYLDKVAESQ